MRNKPINLISLEKEEKKKKKKSQESQIEVHNANLYTICFI